MNTPTIAEIRRKKLKVLVEHRRRYIVVKHSKVKEFLLTKREAGEVLDADETKHGLQAKGGTTKIRIRLSSGVEIERLAHCNLIDPYCKKEGIRVGMGKLMNDFGELKTELS